MRQDGWIALVGMVAVLWLALVGMARPAAAHGGDANIVHACVGKVIKIPRIVGPSGACSANLETALHWGIVGPAGLPGDKGDKGDQGLQGLKGDKGDTGDPGLLDSFDALAGLACTMPGGGPGTIKVFYLEGQQATLACSASRHVDLGLVVFDTQTGLMWEKKVAGGGCLHCVDNTYSWCNATGIASGCVVTNNWIAAVNAEAFAGFTDWRVPTGGAGGGELAGILLEPSPCDDRNPCIDPIFGPTASAGYWSATEDGLNDAWHVDFADGDVFNGFKNFNVHVRAVRGGP